jgi:hexosaminidase
LHTNPLNLMLRSEISRRDVLRLCAMSALMLRTPTPVAHALTARETQITHPDQGWTSPVPGETIKAAPAALIPFPKQAMWENRWLDVSGGFDPVGNISMLSRMAVKWPDVVNANSRVQAHVSVQPKVAPKPEGYVLTVDSKKVTIVGADAAGVFYAIQTLRQLAQRHSDRIVLPCGSIRDWPAFAVRGFMHDTGRNFRTIDTLKAQIDLAAAYKINVFHWHLTDKPAWRIQSRIYPQLNDPRFRTAGRDENSTYSFDDLRDVIAYAKRRHVQVLPELDMPGHSDCFTGAFGFPMDDPRGQAVLEQLLEEFCGEISQTDCPWLHLGSDEVKINNPVQFVQHMSARVRALGRLPVMWAPGLPNDSTLVEQTWSEDATARAKSAPAKRFIDSSMGYANNFGTLEFVQRYYFGQPCLAAEGTDSLRGAILCIWPDIRVDDKATIERYNAVWPGILTLAEAAWAGRPSRGETQRSVLPDPCSAAGRDFIEFENRLAAHRDTAFVNVPFPFVKFSAIPWQIAGPFLPSDPDRPQHGPADQMIIQAFRRGPVKRVWGGTVTLGSRHGESVFPHAVISDVYAVTWIRSDTGRNVRAWIGFETPDRSNRQYGGIPEQGQWDAWGADIWVNEIRVAPPRWQQPDKFKYLNPTWDTPANEIPLTDEELYWTREPAIVPLVTGWNRLLIKAPCGYLEQNWSFTFVPVRQNASGRWVEDESLTYGSLA